MRNVFRLRSESDFEIKDGITKCESCGRIMEGKVETCTNPDCPDPTNVAYIDKVRSVTPGLCLTGEENGGYELHYEPDVEDRLIVTYNVQKGNENIFLYRSSSFSSAITEMRLDTGELIPVTSAYTFDKAGLRTVYYTMKEGFYTIVGSVFNGTSITSAKFPIYSIQFPRRLKTLSSDVFYNNAWLTEIWLPESGLTHVYNNSTFAKTNIRRIKLPQSLVKVANGTFEGCTQLTELIIPKGLIEAKSGCFSNCTRLKRLVFEGTGFSNVGGASLFDGCTSLDTIIFEGTSCERAFYNSNNFTGVSETGTLYVPSGCGSVASFRSLLAKLPSGWQIVEMNDEQ